MRHHQMFVFAIYLLMGKSKAGSDSRFNGDTSRLLATQQQQQNNEQQQVQVNLNAWQPLTGHNNWLILQATAATSIQGQQEQQQHRLPVNYYAYNHRYNPRSTPTNDAAVAAAANGNYKQVRPNLNDSPSYVLAISQTMRSAAGRSESDDGGGDGNGGGDRNGEGLSGLKDEQEVSMHLNTEVREANDFLALTNTVDNAAGGIEEPEASLLNMNNYLAPFEQVVLKVRNFCDTLRSLINVGGDVETEDEEELEQHLVPGKQLSSFFEY